MKKPELLITGSFLALILLGSFLLYLPVSHPAHPLSYQEALFTATSAVTVTGLIVVDTPTAYGRFGHWVILFLIQIGGLGFMTFSTLFLMLLGKNVSLSDRMLVENDFTTGEFHNFNQLIKRIFLFTFTLEGLGAACLFLFFSQVPWHERFFPAFFHAVSAFCNAGFSTFSDSLMACRDNLGVNITIGLLIIFGGLGFLVLSQIVMPVHRRRRKTLAALHTRVVLILSAGLILIGSIFMLLSEYLSVRGASHGPALDVLSSLFQSISARTAGFNTVDLTLLSPAAIMILIALMFIGASPGSTGGGIKPTTLGVLVAYFRSRLKGQENICIHYRQVNPRDVEKAFFVVILSFLTVTASFFLLLVLQPELSPFRLLFEAVSAFGTVGLSLNVTPDLGVGSRWVVMLTMFVGRIGPLTLLMAAARRTQRGQFRYPEEKMMIG